MKLNAYTHDSRMIKFQPLKTKGDLPNWWTHLKTMFKQLDPRTGIKVPTPTIRACPGVIDFIRRPINITMWSDCILKVFPDGRVSCSSPLHNGGEVNVGVHTSEQYGKLYPGRTVLKITNPWVFEGSDRTEFLCTDVHYDTELRKHGIFIAPGVTNFYDQHVCNIFLVIPTKDEPYEIELKYGQPLMSVFPMTNKPVDIKMECVPRERIKEITNQFPPTFLGRYFARKKFRR